MQIRCTQKLLKELGVKNRDLSAIEESDSVLGNWYANIFTLDRRKTIIFVNEITLLSFIMYGIRKDNIKKFPDIFINGVEQVLAMTGVRENIIKNVVSEYSSIILTKTDSKKVLGNMNDLIWMYTNHVQSDGGFKHVDLFEVIARINRTPQRNIGWNYSDEITKELLSATRQ